MLKYLPTLHLIQVVRIRYQLKLGLNSLHHRGLVKVNIYFLTKTLERMTQKVLGF